MKYQTNRQEESSRLNQKSLTPQGIPVHFLLLQKYARARIFTMP
ncbi:MAG: hypothetical protein OEY89_12765 [Gammaproteobacteria bacterium]|nr:hypothetical protein [Gammaproteobacteria bacterium]